MTYSPRARCIKCGTPRALAGGLSRTGKCAPCGEKALAEALASLASKSGPVWEKYRDGMTDYVASLWGGKEIPDSPESIDIQIPLFEVNSLCSGP